MILTLIHFQSGAAEPARRPTGFTEPLFEKTFPLLSAIERRPAIAAVVASDGSLAPLAASKRATLDRLFHGAGEGLSIGDLRFSEEQIAATERALVRLTERRDVKDFVRGWLRGSGMYVRYHGLADGELLAKAWRIDAEGVNTVLRVYGLGENGRSPQIDSISYDPKSILYQALLHNVYGWVKESTPGAGLPWTAPLHTAVQVLLANRRDEASRHEPMERGDNQAAAAYMRSVRWSDYAYTCLLIPGYGPEEAGVVLSPIGRLQCEIAVQRFRSRMAPVIIVSGGYVHPRQTPYCEAIEMKRYLMRQFAIPERAIVIDPHARHTTTNLRNAARLLYRYGAPMDRPGLVVTNTFQSADIASAAFRERCQRTFGYQPFRAGKRLSPFDLEFTPMIDSLQVDPQDPLDP